MEELDARKLFFFCRIKVGAKFTTQKYKTHIVDLLHYH